MKKTLKTLGLIALVAVIGFSITACGGDDTTPDDDDPLSPIPQSVSYVSEDGNGNLYTLVITENTGGRSARYTAKAGDSFTFKVELFNNGVYSVALLFSGTIGSVEDSGTEIEITITVNGKPLTITIEDAEMTVISGDIVDEDDAEVVTTPNDLTPVPEAVNWSSWTYPDATATIMHSVNSKEVCTITIGGTAQPNDETDNYGKWKASVDYSYTPKANTAYAYKFEAWTQSGSRNLNVKFYENAAAGIWLSRPIDITDTRQTHLVIGHMLPRDDFKVLRFEGADQTGTYYVKMLSITEVDNMPAEDRWRFDVDSDATATMPTHSVATDGVCTIEVGGTAQPNENWKVRALYYHVPKVNTAYQYKFEAWTQSGNRTVYVPYYNDYPDFELRLGETITLTPTRTTYTIRGQHIPTTTTKGGWHGPEFNCADQLGTFYVKILSITEIDSLPAVDRWSSSTFSDNPTATITHSVAADGVCTITVGGTAQPNNETDDWGRWKASAMYYHAPKVNTAYQYTFEAWTQSGNRTMWVQYYNDYPDFEPGASLGSDITITSTRKTYTIRGQRIQTPYKGGQHGPDFQCADQLGTFYVKILSITEYTP